MNAITQATAGQIKQISRFGGDAIEKLVVELGLDKDGAQLVITRGDEFVAAIREAASTSLKDLSTTDKFKDEETESTYTYPGEYKGPKPILEQVQALKALFPQLDITATLEFVQTVLPTLQLPAGAEGWFAIPRWQKVADNYGAALEQALAQLNSKRKFKNYREGELGPDRIRQHPRTVAMLEQIGEQQTGDILIVPAQYGMWHRGRSVRRARECFATHEFGFGAFAGSCMALVHPERYVRSEELDTDLPGDEYDYPDDDGRFSHAPILNFNGGRLRFDAHWYDDVYDFYGSVSGFLPQ